MEPRVVMMGGILAVVEGLPEAALDYQKITKKH